LRWSDYVKTTKLSGADRVIQLLEYCDNQTHSQCRGTPTERAEEEVLAAMKVPGGERKECHGGKSNSTQHEAR